MGEEGSSRYDCCLFMRRGAHLLLTQRAPRGRVGENAPLLD